MQKPINLPGLEILIASNQKRGTFDRTPPTSKDRSLLKERF